MKGRGKPALWGALYLAGALLLLSGCSSSGPAPKGKDGQGAVFPQGQPGGDSKPVTKEQADIPLIPASATVERTNDLVKDPNRDPLPKDKKLAEQVKLGYLIFTDTPKNAPQYSGNDLSCRHCHLNAGQKEGALPLAGIANVFPQYNGRAGRLFSLEDRIVGCFMRSMNGVNAPGAKGLGRNENAAGEIAPSPRGKEVLAVAAYLTWLSEGQANGKDLSWRGKNKIDKEKRIPIEKLDPKLGKRLYEEKCAACHGSDGAGKEVAPGLKPGPLWGPRSWNDGAGTSRIYTLAGYVRYAMPLSAPGSLTDEEAQQIAAYIDAHDRPVFPEKDKDFLVEKIPSDAVYYPKLFKENPLVGKLGE